MSSARCTGHACPVMRALIRLGTARFVARPVPAPTFRAHRDPGRVGRMASPSRSAGPPSLGGFAVRRARALATCAGRSTRCRRSPSRGRRWQPEFEDARAAGRRGAGADRDRRRPARALPDRPSPATPGAPSATPLTQPRLPRRARRSRAGLLNTTSCSAWRTYAEAKEYAYKPGGHAEAMRRDLAEVAPPHRSGSCGSARSIGARHARRRRPVRRCGAQCRLTPRRPEPRRARRPGPVQDAGT